MAKWAAEWPEKEPFNAFRRLNHLSFLFVQQDQKLEREKERASSGRRLVEVILCSFCSQIHLEEREEAIESGSKWIKDSEGRSNATLLLDTKYLLCL